MKLIPLQQINLSSSNVTASTYDEWSDDSVSYSVGDNVKVTDSTTSRVDEYECTESHTSSSDSYPPNDSTNWLYLGASNRWKMFDDYVNTQTSNLNTIEVTISTSSFVDTVALFNLEALTVQVVCKDDTIEVFNTTYDLSVTTINNWYDYFFEDFKYKSDLFVTIPGLYKNLTVEITITASTNNDAKCGHCVLGKSLELGCTTYSPTISINDYSTKSTNEFGETYLNQRTYAKTISAIISIDSVNIDRVMENLANIRSTPCVWQFNEDTFYNSLTIYGFFKDFSILLQSPLVSTCNLEIEGLI